MNNFIRQILRTVIKTSNKQYQHERTPSEEKKILAEIEARLSTIESRQNDIQKVIIEKCWNIEKVLVEKLETEKVEFSFDTIDVKELSGMLSIGINSDCELVKEEHTVKSENNQKRHPKDNSKESTQKKSHKEPSQNNNPPKINIKYDNN
ncbi:MAG: hypothetical protein FH758_02045 [Firmicutes bacterium]|nr:hypothetical protein [Bacillota bacterium]